MKKDGTKYLALIQFPNDKEEWMVVHWGKPAGFFDPAQKSGWINGVIPPKIKNIIEYYELSEVLNNQRNKK